MPSLQLSEKDLRETLRRAQEIAQQSRGLAEAEPELAYETYLQAAEEVGIPREATLQALRERLLTPVGTVQPGYMVFAPSVDGAWYPATVARIDGQMVTVRFVSGDDHSCTLSDLRPLALLPGRHVQCHTDWGWSDGTVRTYDPAKGQVQVETGGEITRRPLAKIRLAPRPTTADRRAGRAGRVILCTALVSGLAGIGIGFVLSLLLR
jgi:hypothetical protein